MKNTLTSRADEIYQTAGNKNPNVPGHFSAKGIEILGTIAGQAYHDALKQNAH